MYQIWCRVSPQDNNQFLHLHNLAVFVQAAGAIQGLLNAHTSQISDNLLHKLIKVVQAVSWLCKKSRYCHNWHRTWLDAGKARVDEVFQRDQRDFLGNAQQTMCRI